MKVFRYVMLIPLIIPLYIFIQVGLEGSKYKPIEFFKIEEERFERDDDIVLIEYFLVSNPPQSMSLLKEMTEEHIFETLSLDTLKKYSHYSRHYFRETVWLTRNYKKGEPYPNIPWWSLDGWLNWGFNGSWHFDSGQQIDKHYDTNDRMMGFYYNYFPKENYWEYEYDYGYKKLKNTNKIKIKDIDSFFIENKKKYQ